MVSAWLNRRGRRARLLEKGQTGLRRGGARFDKASDNHQTVCDHVPGMWARLCGNDAGGRVSILLGLPIV